MYSFFRPLILLVDVNHNGFMDENEFVCCLEALELKLSRSEMLSLLISASSNALGEDSPGLTFEEFKDFLTRNLVSLEKQKHLRILQAKLHVDSAMSARSIDRPSISIGSQDEVSGGLTHHLGTVFRILGKNADGFIAPNDVADVLKSLDVKLPANEFKLLLQDIPVSDQGLMDHKACVPICAELLETYRAFKIALETRNEKEKWATTRADILVANSADEIHTIARFIKERISLVYDTIPDASNRHTSLSEALKNPQSGLSRHEANIILNKIFLPPSNPIYGLVSSPSSFNMLQSQQSIRGEGLGTPSRRTDRFAQPQPKPSFLG